MSSAEKKITYFNKPGAQNTEEVIECAYERAKQGDIKQVVVATFTGNTVLKLAEKFNDLDVNIVAITVWAGTAEERRMLFDNNMPTFDKLGIKHHRATHALAGIERAVKARWGGYCPGLLISDALRLLGDGTKVCVEIILMAADAGLIDMTKDVMAIVGSGGGADTCLIIKPSYTTNLFDLGIKEIVCKPVVEGIKHEAR